MEDGGEFGGDLGGQAVDVETVDEAVVSLDGEWQRQIAVGGVAKAAPGQGGDVGVRQHRGRVLD